MDEVYYRFTCDFCGWVQYEEHLQFPDGWRWAKDGMKPIVHACETCLLRGELCERNWKMGGQK